MKVEKYGDYQLHYLGKGEDLDLSGFVPGFYGVDTERMGLETLRDRLCVLQIYNMYNRVVYVMSIPKEPLSSEYVNLKLFLNNPSFCKIFHYAMGDISSLYTTFKVEIRNTLCTKVMSKVARTYTNSHGLASLVNSYLKRKLDKSSQMTYWGGALTPKQIHYSVNDVLYLHELVVILLRLLTMEDRVSVWLRFNESVEKLAHNVGLGWNYNTFLDWA